MLRDTLGSSASSVVAIDYIQKHSDAFHHWDDITISLKAATKQFVDTLSDPLVEAEFIKGTTRRDNQLDDGCISDCLTSYQTLKELLLTTDFNQISNEIVERVEHQDMSMEVNYIKRNFSRFALTNQVLHTNFSTIWLDNQAKHHKSHILVPKGIALPDIVAKSTFGMKNFNVKEQGEIIQQKVYQNCIVKNDRIGSIIFLCALVFLLVLR